MKIVHLSTNAFGGGAALATYRIHSKLIERGVDSNLIVFNSPKSKLQNVSVAHSNKFQRVLIYVNSFIEKIILKIYSYKKPSCPFSLNIVEKINIENNQLIKNADIVCIYWIGHGF